MRGITIDLSVWNVLFQHGKEIEVVGANTRSEVMRALTVMDTEEYGYIKKITKIK